MATPVIMPRQGQSVESCIIAKWHKHKGDPVAVGDLLFTYETDKATFDEEAQVAGTLIDVFFEEGDDVACLLNVCVIGEPGEDTAPFRPGSAQEDAAEAPTPAPAAAEAAQEAKTGIAVAAVGADKPISPRARNLAEKKGIDYRFAEGTGPHGRIIERDVLALEEAGLSYTMAAKEDVLAQNGRIPGTGLGGRVTVEDAAARRASGGAYEVADVISAAIDRPETEEVPLPNIRKVIAKAMHTSLSTTAQLTLNSSFDATDILAYRKQLKAHAESLGLPNITLNDMVLYAVSRTLPGHPDLNALLTGDTLTRYHTVMLGCAVDTPRGLMVPTIRNAEQKSLAEIAKEAKALAAACQSGTVNPDVLSGGSFTVTNLGSLGVESFTPVLNAPQVGILGVCSITQRIREVDGDIQTYPAMGLSLTFDHRAVDGAPAARFLKDLVSNLEHFSVLLAQ